VAAGEDPPSGPSRGVHASFAFTTVDRFCMVVLYERAGRLTAENGGFPARAVEYQRMHPRLQVRAHSHCRFVLPPILCIPDPRSDSVPRFLKRPCDWTLRQARRDRHQQIRRDVLRRDLESMHPDVPAAGMERAMAAEVCGAPAEDLQYVPSTLFQTHLR
jgi:hypothetical protein